MNLQRAVQNLSRAISYKTVTNSDFDRIDRKSFEDFLAFIRNAYPLVHEKLELKMINTFAPVFHWKSSHESAVSKKPVLLTAHYDVVPAIPADWSHDPFSGYICEENITGRGAIDDKNTLIALMETVETMLEQGYEPHRDIYLAFGFDEEVGGLNGAVKIAEHFKNEGIRFDMVLDEGGVVTTGDAMGIAGDVAVIGLAEKGNTNIELIFTGDEGHSSMPPKNTSIGKMAAFIHSVESNPRKAKLVEPVLSMLSAITPHKKGFEAFALKNPGIFGPIIKASLGKGRQTAPMTRSTVAFTMTDSGTAPNVLPKKASCVANIRVLPGDTVTGIIDWLKSFGHDFEVRPILLEEASKCSSQDTAGYSALKKTIGEVFADAVITPYLMVGGTDARKYEDISDGVYRFMPCRLTASDLSKMHGTNEYISKKNLEQMLKFYKIFIENLDY